ncbi:MAG: Kelch repeat-containing protein [Actinomycetota bacterium]
MRRTCVSICLGILTALGGLVSPAHANHFPWRMLNPPAPTPAPRLSHYAVTDESQRNVVMFGGCGKSAPGSAGACDPADPQYLGDTWIWDGTLWSQVTTGPSPSTRAGHAMAYDRARSQVLLFGGQGANGLLGDTWAYRGATRTWTKLAETGPVPRVDSAMASDPQGRVVLYGGSEGSGQTWAFDGNSWTQLFPEHSPTASGKVILRHGMIFDPARNNTVLYGGSVVGTNPGVNDNERGETWTWNGADWSQPPGTGTFGSSASNRHTTRLAWDSEKNLVVLAGGWSGGESFITVYSWDGTSWTGYGHSPSAGGPNEAPRERTLHSLAFDPVTNHTLLFGGRRRLSPYPPLNDSWIWKGWEGTDLSLAVVDTPDPVVAGMKITYKAVLINQGPALAPNANLKMSFPENVDFDHTAPAAGCSYSQAERSATCTLGTLDIRQVVSFDVVVTARQAGEVVTRATASSKNMELTPADNEATISTTAIGPPPAVTLPPLVLPDLRLPGSDPGGGGGPPGGSGPASNGSSSTSGAGNSAIAGQGAAPAAQIPTTPQPGGPAPPISGGLGADQVLESAATNLTTASAPQGSGFTLPAQSAQSAPGLVYSDRPAPVPASRFAMSRVPDGAGAGLLMAGPGSLLLLAIACGVRPNRGRINDHPLPAAAPAAAVC